MPVLDDPLHHPRFVLEARLGQGGMGTVYRAYDREREAHVALKLLEKITPSGLYRFKNEFRALGGVSHPNLLTLYELMSTGTHWFLTMELIDGVDLLTHVRLPEGPAVGVTGADQESPDINATAERAPTPLEPVTQPIGSPVAAPRWNTARPLRSPGELAALRAALAQLFAGLHALHAAGHLHRDVKPSNILVARDGRVVVVDFGILLARNERSSLNERVVIGTPAYMAPEQAAGGALSPACDWYAVGTIIYELLCGRRPFTGNTEVLLALKQTTEPPPIRTLNPEAPADLVELCERLMQKRPEDRPQGPELVGELRTRLAPGPAGLAFHVGGEAPVLVGRSAELATLGRAWQEASTGTLRTVLLSGRSGTGKTALMEHFLADVRARGGTVVVGRTYQQESVPYKALDGLMDALARHVADTDDGVRAELAPALRTLGALFPVLRREEDDHEGADAAVDQPADPMARRRRLAPALRDLLSRVAGHGPLCLVLDDAQWGDTESAVLLGQALARPWNQPVLVVLTFRAEEEGAAFLRTFTRWVAADVTLSLLPLGADDAAELVRRLLAARGADPAHIARIVKDAGGVPLYLSELAFHAVDVSGASGVAEPGAGADALVGFTAMLRARVEALPAPARALLQAVSLAAQPIAQGVAARAANLTSADPSALVLLRNQHLIRYRTTARGELLEAFHDRIREFVSASLPPDLLSGLHRRLALALEAQGGDPETLVTHFAACGELAQAGLHAGRAAELAARALAFDRAAALYLRALELRAPLAPEAALPLHIGLARAYADGGRGLASATAYRQAAALSSDAATRSQLLSRAAEQLLTCGYVDDGVTLIKELLLEIGEKPREFSVIGVARFLATRSRLRLRGRGFVARREEDVDRRDLDRLDLYWAAGAAFGLLNPFQGVDFVSRHMLHALRVGEPHRIARGLAAESFASAIDDSPAGTRKWRKLVAAARELALEVDDPRAIGIACSAEAMGLHQRAFFRSGSAMAKQAARILRARCEQAHHEIHIAEMIVLWTMSYIGEMRELDERAVGLAAEAEERGDLHRLATVQTGLPSLRFLVAGHLDEQTRIREEIVARLSPGYVDSPMLFHVMLGEALGLLYRGDAARVWPLVTACEPRLRRSQSARVPALRLRCLWTKTSGALAAAWSAPPGSSERAEHLGRAEQGLGQLVRDPLPLARPYADHARASLAAIAGKSEEAGEWLRKAHVGYEAVDCVTDVMTTRWQAGLLEGGDEGERMVEESEAWMRGEGVRDVGRFVATLAPPVG